MTGVKYACLYSYKCEKATKLGINDQLLDYVQNYSRSLEKRVLIISLLKKLTSYSGYQAISKLIKKDYCFDEFDERIVRAYWLGKRGLYLIHNLAVLEKFSIINADEHLSVQTINESLGCAISWGEVVEINPNQKRAKVLNHGLLYQKGRIIFGTETREVDTLFVSQLKKGELVSIHRSIAREKISQKQATILEDITLKALKKSQNGMIE